MNIRFVGIITKHNSPEVHEKGKELLRWFGAADIKAELDVIDPEMDMLVILGGDGTLLHVADQAGQYDIPVVGINCGNLGFLTEVGVKEMYSALETILHGSVHVEERMMLKARLINGSGEERGEPCFVLNEVVLAKGAMERVVRLSCWADREYISTYKADGLIISTPTGSTAYNLSAGGPIVHAELDGILVTPICPFMLESRPVFLSPSSRVTIQLADSVVHDVKVIVDGRFAWDIGKDDCLLVETAKNPLRLISSPHKGYFAILRNKLNWGGKNISRPLPVSIEPLLDESLDS